MHDGGSGCLSDLVSVGLRSPGFLLHLTRVSKLGLRELGSAWHGLLSSHGRSFRRLQQLQACRSALLPKYHPSEMLAGRVTLHTMSAAKKPRTIASWHVFKRSSLSLALSLSLSLSLSLATPLTTCQQCRNKTDDGEVAQPQKVFLKSSRRRNRLRAVSREAALNSNSQVGPEYGDRQKQTP